MLGACALATWLATPRIPGMAGVMAAAVVFTAAVVLVHLLPAALGAFTVGPVLGAAAALVAAAALATRRWPAARDAAPGLPPEAATRDPAPSRLLAGGAAVVTAGCALALVRDLAGAPITSIDALNFQVPIVARWLQEDSVWGLHQFIADYSNATYPMNGNVIVAAVLLPFDSAFLARLVAVPYWALAGAGAYAIARELGAPRAPAVLGATALAALPVSIRSGLEGVQTDAPMLACMAAGVLFLLRHARTAATADLVLAGVGLGLAFGTKWYAVTGVAAILAVWAAARALGRAPVVRPTAVLCGLIAIAGGFWLLRNLVATGNPVFPQPLGPFDAPPDTLRALGGFTLAHYALDFGVWETYLRPAFAATFGWTGAALAAGALLAAARRPRGRALAILAGTLVLALVYVTTPYSAFGPEGRPVLAAASTRYAFPALLGAAVLTAWALGRLGRARLAGETLLALAIVDGLRRGFGDLSAAKALGGSLAAGAVVAAAVWLGPRMRPASAAVLALAVLAAGVLAVEGTRRRANDQGYGRFDPVLARLDSGAAPGARIGLAGVWSTEAVSPVLPAFGPRLGNAVVYLGEFREHMLRQVAPEDLPERARGFDLVVVGRGAPPRADVPQEAALAGAGWSRVAASARLSLWRAP